MGLAKSDYHYALVNAIMLQPKATASQQSTFRSLLFLHNRVYMYAPCNHIVINILRKTVDLNWPVKYCLLYCFAFRFFI